MTSLRDLADLARSQPKQITVATGGLGGQLAGRLFDMVANVETVSVSHKWGGAAAIDVAGGHVDVLIASPASPIPLVHSGKLRPIAVTGSSRLPAMPNVMTSKEAGFQDLEAVSWFSLAAPAGTSKEVIAKLSAALREALSVPSVRIKLATHELEAQPAEHAQSDDGLREDRLRAVGQSHQSLQYNKG